MPENNVIDLQSIMGRGQSVGLAQPSPYKWEPPTAYSPSGASRPIDYLVPRSKTHTFILDYLMQRLRWSEQKMAQFYPRWRENEMRLQAFVTLPDYESSVQSMVDNKQWRAPDQIVVPYAWSTQQTIVTYLLQTFAGRKPIVQVGAYKGEQVMAARNMEMLLQFNADYIRHLLLLYKYFNDGETYGVAIFRNIWRQETRKKSFIQQPSPDMAYMMNMMGQRPQPTRGSQDVVCFEGNSVAVINPFLFFPDPRVPMHEVAERGEFCFWRSFEGRHHLLREQMAGRLKWVEYADSVPRGNSFGNDSVAGIRALGDSLTGGSMFNTPSGVTNNMQIDQGTIEIIPAELGLGTSRTPEKWIFTILNQSQIVQAEPLNLNHGKHPVNVTEPNYFGNAFGSLATTDLLAPHQDLMSWLVNSHMFNVRATLNNLLIVDPSKVEIDDLLDPQPGGIIRLKSTPFGAFKPDEAIKQLQMFDVTRSHLQDFQLMGRMGADMTGATDNIRGMQEAGGRKSATEVRTAIEGGASRLAFKARIYSAMGITPQGEQWASNYQQFLTQEFEARITGQDGQTHSVRLNPETIDGDFYFPIHDGTLPLDTVTMMDVWKEIWLAIVQDPSGQLRQQYDGNAIFRYMAELGGAQNLAQFQLGGAGPTGQGQVVAAPGQTVGAQAQAGNLVPLSQLQQQLGQLGVHGAGGGPGPIPGLPTQRAA